MRGKRARRLTLLVAFLAVPMLPTLSRSAPAGEEHLPDIRTLAPSDLKIQAAGGGLPRRVLLTNAVWNGGDGPLEMRPENVGSVTTAHQLIYTHDANGLPDGSAVMEEREVGEFVYHPTHFHWHFGGFARYELRNVAPNGGIGTTLLSSSEKVSFCIIETFRARGGRRLEHFGWGDSGGCEPNELQGLSVGYGDEYYRTLPDQFVKLGPVQRGTFWLVSTADFEQRLFETDETNNSAAVKFSVRGPTIQILQKLAPAVVPPAV